MRVILASCRGGDGHVGFGSLEFGASWSSSLGWAGLAVAFTVTPTAATPLGQSGGLSKLAVGWLH